MFSGNCYSKVREETEAMRAAMGEDEYNYNHPRTEDAYIYNVSFNIGDLCVFRQLLFQAAWKTEV